MPGEPEALAATAAAALVGLLVSDAWTAVRQRVAALLPRRAGRPVPVAELEALRGELLAAPDPASAADSGPNRAAVLDLLGQDPAAARQLLALAGEVASSRNAGTPPGTVRNMVSGGVLHGPLVQSGTISGLTFTTPPAPAASPEPPEPGPVSGRP